jgi:CBS domain-containing protein
VLFVVGTVVYALFAHGYSALYREFIVIWDVVIAFFIYSGAQAEMQNAFIRQGVADLKAKDAITKDFVVVKSDTNVADLYRTMVTKQIHIVLFKKSGAVKILSNSSLQKLLKKPAPYLSIENFGITIPDVPYNMSLYGAIERMRSAETSIAAVTKSGQIIGVLLSQHIESIIALHISQKNQAKNS